MANLSERTTDSPRRGYAHSCVDQPMLPCPGCGPESEHDKRRAAVGMPPFQAKDERKEKDQVIFRAFGQAF